jgi:hypothetical protein
LSDAPLGNVPTVFSADELATRERSLAALEKLVKGGSALLFAGAGVSVPAGYPSWDKLLSELEEICTKCGGSFSPDSALRQSDPLLYADRIKGHIKTMTGDLARYEKHLQKRFLVEPNVQQFHRDIITLPFRGFLTTNYDSTLEVALLTEEPSPIDKAVVVGADSGYMRHHFMQSLVTPNAPRLVAHLHGYYRQPSSIVLGGADYTATYGSRSEAARDRAVPSFLRTILSAWSLVFVGFSFADPYLSLFLRAVSNDFQLWGDSNHFALIDTSIETHKLDVERADRYREEFGLETVFYEKRMDSHTALYALVASLNQAIVGQKRSPILDEINDRMSEAMRE